MMLLGSVLGALLAGGIVLLVAAWQGWTPPRPTLSTSGRLADFRSQGWKALVAVIAVAAITRWPVAAVAAGAFTWLWPQLFGGGAEGRAQLIRLEAIATWTESLRDTMAAAVGLEQAISASVDVAPEVIQPQLRTLVGRLQAKVPLQQALASFAGEFDDASVDLVVAALIMNARLRGSGLVGTLTALATTARAELDMRTRVEEGRKLLRRSANIIIGVTACFAGGMMIFSRTYLEPYGSVTGQLVLAVVVAGFVVGFAWIRSASRAEPDPRFLATSEQIARMGAVA